MRPLLVALALAAAGCRAPMPVVDAPATIYVVRHAERLDDTDDPSLSAAGTARADAVRDSLARWGLPQTVWATRFARAQQTAQPTARHAVVDVRTYGSTADAAADVRALATTLRATLRRGERALVVGHSNTVPPFLSALDGRHRPDLHRGDYDGLYVVTLREGRATVRRVRFGADDGVADPAP